MDRNIYFNQRQNYQYNKPNYSGCILFLGFICILMFIMSSFSGVSALQKHVDIHTSGFYDPFENKVPNSNAYTNTETIINNSVGTETNKPPEVINRFAQYDDIDILTSIEDIEISYQNMVNDLDNNMLSSITQLKELHEKKLLTEEEYFAEVRKQLEKHYELLKERYVLAVEKKELEEKLRSVNENLYNKNNKLHESVKKQQQTLDNKINVNKGFVDKEKQIMDEQYNRIKKLV